MTNDFVKKIYLVTAIALFIACLPLPIGFYTFLRLIVFISIVILMYNIYKLDNNDSTQLIIYGLIGLLFNPLFPIYLNDKLLWVIIDLGLGIYFIRKFKIN